MISGAKKPTIHLPPIPKSWRMFKLWVAAALRRIAAASGHSVQIDGADGASVGSDGSLRFKINPTGSGSCVYNWQPALASKDGDGNSLITLEPGSIYPGPGSGITVGSGIITDSPRPQLTIPGTADTTQIVYLQITVTPSVVDGFVEGCDVTSAVVGVSTSLPSGSSTVAYVELFRWRNGALISQLNKYNFLVSMRGPSGIATIWVGYGAYAG